MRSQTAPSHLFVVMCKYSIFDASNTALMHFQSIQHIQQHKFNAEGSCHCSCPQKREPRYNTEGSNA